VNGDAPEHPPAPTAVFTTRRRRRPHRRLLEVPVGDPLSGVANLFDLALVLAAALLVASHAGLRAQNAKNPAGAAPQDALPQQKKIRLPRYRVSDRELTGDGTRLGTAYQLPNGDVVYVPDPPHPPGAVR